MALKEGLNHNDTVYHYACSSKYNQQKLDCAPEKFNKIQSKQKFIDTQSPPCKRRSKGLNRITFREVICCFCRKTNAENDLDAAGTHHAKQSKPNMSHVNKLTK